MLTRLFLKPHLFCFVTLLLLKQAWSECSISQWECNSKDECINQEDLCDGKVQCKDESDESFHYCSDLKCPGYAFRCSYGGCVESTAECDGKIDCADKSDELLSTCEGVLKAPKFHNCSDSQFPCLTGDECIAQDLKCDGAADCKDSSDETITQCRDFPCPGYAFRCAYGGCVDSDAACNGRDQCADGSDEYAPKCNKTAPPPKPKPPPVNPGGSTDTRVGTCRLPPPPENGYYSSYNCEAGSTLPQCSGIEGTEVGTGFDLRFQCYNGFSLRGNTEQYCRAGGWYPKDVPMCSDQCEPIFSSKLEVHCYASNFSLISCKKQMPPNSFVKFKCLESIYVKVKDASYDRLACVGGNWNRPLPEELCQPACGNAVLKFAEPVISYGEIASFGSFPWHAGIYEYSNQTNSWVLNCGGSLVSHNLVVSAAHCFIAELRSKLTLVERDIKMMRVLLGKRYREIDHDSDKFAQSFEIKKAIWNQDYSASKTNYANDVALVVLSRSVQYSPAVLPVCMDIGRDSSEDDQLIPGAVGMVAGFGLTEKGKQSDELLVAQMPYVPREVCMNSSNLYVYVTKDKLCAGDPKSKTNVCRGDSGGGLVFKDQRTKNYYLRGIVSLGVEGCEGQDYALFTKVSKHSELINKYL